MQPWDAANSYALAKMAYKQPAWVKKAVRQAERKTESPSDYVRRKFQEAGW